ncbi:MAG: Rap1a/Tai family immunity protein [Bdellovibrio bacteriovorus]
MPPRQNRFRPLARACAVLMAALFLPPTPAVAGGPAVGDLIAVCDRAFDQGFGGVEAATCEWFAVPCGCKRQDSEDRTPPWCVPEGEPIDLTVRKVVAALRLDPNPEAPAEPAVRAALARLYPCAEKPKPLP